MGGFWTKAGQGADGTAKGMHGVAGFISATARLFDPGCVTGQKLDIDAAASTAGVAVDAYLVELSPRCEGETWTPAVRDLLLLARAGRVRGIALGGIGRFAADRDDALLVAVTLAGFGVRIIEADCAAPVAASLPVIRTPRRRRPHRSLAGVAS